MKNKLSDIFSAFTLALPLALLAGVVSLAVNSNSGTLFLCATLGTLLLAWPVLARVCQQGRRPGRRHTFRLRLIAGMLLLPAATTAIMFGAIQVPGGYAGGVFYLFMCVAGAATVTLGWLGAAIAYAFGGRETL